MAPHVHSHTTSAPEGAPFQHDPLNRRSLSTTTLATGDPSPSSPGVLHVELSDSLPNFGVGPLIELQPSPARSEETGNIASSDQPGSSPRLAYLSILVIPIIGGIAIYFLIRRRKRQKPAKRSTTPPFVLRSASARARADSENARMRQLPRDRIRAMNSVNRDSEMPSAPPGEYQIFSPRPPSPSSPSEYPRPLGNFFSSAPVQGSSEPSTPLTMSAASASTLPSCPPTPCTPCTPSFPMPTVSCPISEDAPGEEDDKGVSRFTWDFRCQGVVKRLSGLTIETILENSEVLGISITEDSDVDASSIILRCVARTERSRSSEDSCTTAEPNTSVSSHDSSFSSSLSPIDPKTLPPEASGSKTLTSSASCYSTASGLTVLDVKLDVTSFSSEVVAALSETPSRLTVKECNSDPSSPTLTKAVEEQTPTKEPKKRPVLSKPNHRNLAPKNPTLKVNSQAVDLSKLGLQNSASPHRAAGIVSASVVPPEIIRSIYRAVRRKRAFSEPNLKRSSSLSGLAAMNALNKRSLEFFKAISRRIKGNRKSGTEGVLLRTSLSMPLALERLCLSHLADKRI